MYNEFLGSKEMDCAVNKDARNRHTLPDLFTLAIVKVVLYVAKQVDASMALAIMTSKKQKEIIVEKR